MPRPTEEASVRKAVAGLPAPQALTELAEILRDRPCSARNWAVAAALDAIASTLNTGQAAIRDGIPVDSEPDTVVTVDEYAVRSADTHLTTYGDRLYSAVAEAQRDPGAELLQRSVIVGPWRSGPKLPTGGSPWWPGLS